MSIYNYFKVKPSEACGECGERGEFLPMQLIYAGKSDRCHPDGFSITHSPNHWSNEELAINHLESIVFPYLQKQRKLLNLPDDQKGLLIFDVFKGQTTEKALNAITENNCVHVFVPPNLTNHFQPLDLNINGFAKQFLKRKFETWYASEVTKQVNNGKNVYNVNIETKLSIVKPLRAKWPISLYGNMKNHPEMILKAFEMAKITPLDEIILPAENPFEDL